MNLNLNNTNFFCSPKTNSNGNIVAYSCNSNRNTENFEATKNFNGWMKYQVIDGYRANGYSQGQGEIQIAAGALGGNYLLESGNKPANYGAKDSPFMIVVAGPKIPKGTYVTNYENKGVGYSSFTINTTLFKTNGSFTQESYMDVYFAIIKPDGEAVTKISNMFNQLYNNNGAW